MSEERRDYYEILGLERDADPRAVKEAFRKLSLRYHPDRSWPAVPARHGLWQDGAVRRPPAPRVATDWHG